MSVRVSLVREVVLLVIVMMFSATQGIFADDSEGTSKWRHEFVMVPMRDGIRLGTYIWYPEGKGPWPVVLVRTPYGGAGVVDWESERLLENGYCIVGQDLRGRHRSEGEALAFSADGWGEHKDGYDCVEWVARQPWCTGKVGTWGKSGPGNTQTLMAGAAPPSLACQHIGLAASDMFRQSFYQGGVLRLELVMWWLHAGGWDLDAHARMAVQHPTYDNYWRKMNLNEQEVRPNAPMLNWSGWYDIYNQGAIDAFLAGRNGGPRAKDDQILIMGPWPHGIAKDFGEARLPHHVLTPPMIDALTYFDYYLKGKKNEVAEAKPVYYYTIGDILDPECELNRWRTADDWPISCTYRSLYLHDGDLSFQRPGVKQGSRSFVYDPQNPVPTLGGNNLFLDKGPFDNRELDKRSDVLVYTGSPLDEDIEVTGRIKVRLFVSTDCLDTDFTAKLCDVYPDGRSINVLDGIVRMRFTDDLTRERLLEPGKIYEAEIDLWSTSWVFRKRHSIRVDISSSNYPRFETNSNTGEVFPLSVRLDDPTKPNLERHTVKAKNTVYSGLKYPSRIVLPIINN